MFLLGYIVSLLGVFFAYTVAAVPFEEYILAPSSRALHPVSIHATNGTVNGAESIAGDGIGSATFEPYSAVAFDFGTLVSFLDHEVVLMLLQAKTSQDSLV